MTAKFICEALFSVMADVGFASLNNSILEMSIDISKCKETGNSCCLISLISVGMKLG